MTAEDFTTLFAPNGQFDRFFRDNLAPLVDTGVRPWRWRKTARHDGIASESLGAFERAAALRDAFFNGPSGALSIPFDVTPVSIEGSIDSALVTVDGQQVAYAKGESGSPRPVALVWPNPSSAPAAAISFQPGGAEGTIQHRGLWAAFRVLDAGRLQLTGPDRARVTFTTGGGQATFDLHAETGANPFDLANLHDFRCPKTF
jgi:type VI secretion system protein ImpL